MKLDVLEKLLESSGYYGKSKVVNSEKGVELLINCPFHNESNPSFGINTDKEVFHCFSCREAGGLDKLIAKLRGITIKEAREILSNYTYYNEQEVKPSIFKDYDEVEKEKVLSKLEIAPFRSGKSLNPYLEERGFTLETVKKFRIGWNTNTQMITIPMFDRDEELKGWVERTVIDPHEPEFKYIYGDCPKYKFHHLKKSKMLFPLNLVDFTKDTIILVEGTLDVIWMHQLGYTNTLSILSASFNKDQAKLLKRHMKTNKVVLFLDNDVAGERATEGVYKILRDDFIIYNIEYPDGMKDPCDLSDGQIANMLQNKEHYKGRRVNFSEYD